MLSPFFLVGLVFGLRSGVDRTTAMTHKFLPFFDDSFGGLAQLLPLLIEVVNSLAAALAQQIPRFFACEQRGHQPTDGPETQTDKQEEKLGFTVGSHAFILSFVYAHPDTVWR
jgi:hypothetical protein